MNLNTLQALEAVNAARRALYREALGYDVDEKARLQDVVVRLVLLLRKQPDRVEVQQELDKALDLYRKFTE